MKPKTFVQKLIERKFFVPVVAALGILVAAKTGVEIPQDALDAIVALVITFVGVEGVKDTAAVIKGPPKPPE